MSVESTITKVIYVGNGVATEWPVPFKYNKPEHLHLLLTDAAGARELVTSNFQVQVTEAWDTSILYPVSGQPLPAGTRLTIFRTTPQTQIVDLIYGGAFAPEVLEEDGLDREVMMIQELQEGLNRAVKVDIDSDETPEELLENIFTARDKAVDSATSAAAQANAAAESARGAAVSEAIATEEREAACICAGEARDARDVAIAQTEAANTLMEAELAKVNAIVAANRTDQEAAVSAARAWAEKEADVPVEYDEDGNPLYSARHWADNAQKIAVEPPTAERRGAVRVGAGLHLETGENGETDVLAVMPDGVTTRTDAEGQLSAIGGNLLLNSEVWITVSGTWTAPVRGWYDVLVINGGTGAYALTTNTVVRLSGGPSGTMERYLFHIEEGEQVPVTIGAGGLGSMSGNPPAPGYTYFNGQTARDWSPTAFRDSGSFCLSPKGSYHMEGRGGGLEGIGYGAGGRASSNATGTEVTAAPGIQGAVRVRWYDPAKAGGPAPVAAFLSARRAAPRAAADPATVNLYDPETGQGSVWRVEDADAKLAEGMITEEAWLEICAAKAAEDRTAWLADPETEAERFAMLRAAREVKLTDYDAAVAELRRKERAGVDVTAALAAWDTYAEALCALPQQPGAPWDGGGELTPWPDAPVVEKAQGQE